jgi:hypothetical protein
MKSVSLSAAQCGPLIRLALSVRDRGDALDSNPA